MDEDHCNPLAPGPLEPLYDGEPDQLVVFVRLVIDSAPIDVEAAVAFLPLLSAASRIPCASCPPGR
jgi:hypothetical protein